MKISKRILEQVKIGYKYLKDKDDHAVYVKLRDDDEKYIDYIMIKHNYYYGDYVFFESGVYGCTFDSEFLESLIEKKENQS